MIGLYGIGFFVTLGRMMVQSEGEEDSFKTGCWVFFLSLIWPIMLGIEIEEHLQKESK